jgi:Cu-Zn family superoxide dismutase
MHIRPAAILVAATLPRAACATVADLPAQEIGSAALMLANSQPAGVARLVAVNGQVTLAVGLTGIAPGVHGIHLHTVGQCNGPDFASAGGHLNPLGKHHGSLAEGGKHEGDLPNVTIQPGGSGALTADISGTPDQVHCWLFDADGSAIVVHAEPDDYRTDPSGNSGARIACGVIKPA